MLSDDALVNDGHVAFAWSALDAVVQLLRDGLPELAGAGR